MERKSLSIRLSVDGYEPVLFVGEFGRGALVIDNLAADDDFVTFLWCGQTFALGAFRGWDGQKSVTLDDAEHLSQRIIARGPVRVIAEMVCDEWNAPTSTPNAKPITLRQRFTQWAGHRGCPRL